MLARQISVVEEQNPENNEEILAAMFEQLSLNEREPEAGIDMAGPGRAPSNDETLSARSSLRTYLRNNINGFIFSIICALITSLLSGVIVVKLFQEVRDTCSGYFLRGRETKILNTCVFFCCRTCASCPSRRRSKSCAPTTWRTGSKTARRWSCSSRAARPKRKNKLLPIDLLFTL